MLTQRALSDACFQSLPVSWAHSHWVLGVDRAPSRIVQSSQGFLLKHTLSISPSLLTAAGCQFAVAIAYPTFHLALSLFTFFTLFSCYPPASFLRGSSSKQHRFSQLLHRCNHNLLHWQLLEYPRAL